ncbi:MAG: hypothetical protein R3E32_27955 [Chitinophagales bacterium]
MQTLNAFFTQILNFFADKNTILSTHNQNNTPELKLETYSSESVQRDFFEELPPMEYYILSAHFFMP